MLLPQLVVVPLVVAQFVVVVAAALVVWQMKASCFVFAQRLAHCYNHKKY